MDLWRTLLGAGRDGGPRDLGLLLLRSGLAGAMMTHGYGKLMAFAELSQKFPDPLGVGSTASLSLAIFAEFFCAVAVLAGFLTRWAVIPIVITMLVAFFVIHGDDPFGERELAWTYLVGLTAVLLAGAGRYSLDALLKKR